jgi:hypothetical protein
MFTNDKQNDRNCDGCKWKGVLSCIYFEVGGCARRILIGKHSGDVLHAGDIGLIIVEEETVDDRYCDFPHQCEDDKHDRTILCHL